MPLSDPELWDWIWPLPSRAAPIPLVDPFRRHSFSAMLYTASDWTEESVDRVIEIYRKFLYLKAISGGAVTPSKTIDTAWHLHLEFDEDYQALCRATGRELRHDTSLNDAILDKAYLDGLALYEAEFDAPADGDLWPSPTTLANASARQNLLLVAGIPTGMIFVGAAISGSAAYWVAFCAAVLLGFVIRNWSYRRWPGESGPEVRSGCG